MPREACCQPCFTAAGAEAESGGVTRWGHAAFRWNRGDCAHAVWPQSYSTWLLGSAAFTSTFLFQFSHYSPQNSLIFFFFMGTKTQAPPHWNARWAFVTYTVVHTSTCLRPVPAQEDTEPWDGLTRSFIHSLIRSLAFLFTQWIF